jgi:c-di-GMP-binding flagellar brake protein YcgR
VEFETGEAIALDVVGDQGALRLHAWFAGRLGQGIQLTMTSKPPEPPPERGDAVTVHRFRGDGMKSGESTIVLSNWPTLVISAPEKVRVVQRRQSFRVRCDVPLRYTLVEPLQPALAGATEGCARTCDLSAGGIRFRGKGPLPVGSVVRLELSIDGPRPLVVITKLGRSDEVTGGEFWEMSGRFMELSRAEEARLARFVLRCELAQRAADRR